ncbi:amidohydrolase family protein [Hyphomonas sp.]|uniref:amidohydrolase family protein n=1 Tax=Hyphomonas sp. TaxID=87 RepID=UPI0030FC1D4A
MDKLDAHMHVWQLERGDYDWLTPDLGIIYRDFGIDDVWIEASHAGVSRTILVQAAASAAETDYLLGLAATDERVAGVVGWVDFEAPDAAAQIARRAKDRSIVGLRPMIADIPDPNWILEDAFTPALEAMLVNGLVFDAHARPDLVNVMTSLATRYPDLQIVLNHGGKPPIASRELDEWRRDISTLARQKNVACKLSGLLTESGPYSDDVAIGDVVEHLAECFGANRLLWGSDWPVLNMAGSYSQWVRQSERLIGKHVAGHETATWSGNAERIYLDRTGV